MVMAKSFVHNAIVVGAISIAVLGGCSKREAAQSSAAPIMAAVPPVPALPPAMAGQTGEPKQAVLARSLVYTVSTTIRVEDVQRAIVALRSLVTRHGGYVSHGASVEYDGERRGDFEARIPSENLSNFRADLSVLGEVASDTEQVEDVTEQRSDLEARLSNARVHEKRLIELLANKTGQLNDIIAVEKEIAGVRDNIERMDAQQRGLVGRIQFATVRVNLEPKAILASKNPGVRLVQAATNGVRVAYNVVLAIGVIALNAGPTVLVLGLSGFGFFMAIRRLMRRKHSSKNPEVTS